MTEVKIAQSTTYIQVVYDAEGAHKAHGFQDAPPLPRDLASIFSFLADYFAWSYVIGRSLQEEQDVARRLSRRSRRARTLLETGEYEGPEVIYVHMASPLTIISQIPSEWVAGGGLVGLLAFGEYVFTFPIRVAAKWAGHAADKADANLRRALAREELLATKARELRTQHGRASQPRELVIFDPDDPNADIVVSGRRGVRP